VRPELKATLAFLETMTLRPDDLTPEHAAEVRAAGVSDGALRDAVLVCALFNMIVRLADSLGWDVPSWDLLIQRAPLVLDSGYDLGSVLHRA
jgi:alkylhydroperoxidase family enzyme